MQPRLRRRPWWVALGLLAAAFVPATATAAPKPPPISVQNVRAGFMTGTANNLFKVGTWTPVWVQLEAGDERFQGVMELVVPDDTSTPTTVRQPIDLGPRETQRYTVYTRPGTNDPDFEIRLLDASRRVRPIQVNGTSLARFDHLPADVTLVLTIGNPQGVDQVPALPGFATDKNQADHGVSVARVDAASGHVPGRWQGYDAARAVVLDTNDATALARLDSLQGRALTDWVRRGGHLVIAVGANWQKVRDSVLGPILPAVPTGQVRINDLGALESFVAGSTKPITPPGAPAAMVTKLEEIEERGGKVLSRGLGVPLIVRGTHGFGRITLIALDVDQRPFAKWDDKALFWVRAIDLRRQETSTDTNAPAFGGPGRMYRSGLSDLSTRLRQSLEQFEGVKLISFGWVAFFIFLYILLIGPGDYLFLKKVVKRMELTWVTFPLIVLTVSLLAYYAAYVVKGNELKVNKVDVVDVLLPPGPDNAVPASGLVRGTTFLDIFSPQNRDYGMSIVPMPLDRDVPAGGELPTKPPAGTETMLTWFGVPELGFGGMGGGSQMTFAGAGYDYLPPGGAEALDGVRVPIWSTRCLTGRWLAPAPAAPLIDADIRPRGPDRLEGTVTNRSGMALTDAILAYNKQVYIVGTIAAGATVRVELQQDRQLSGHLRSKTANYLTAGADYNAYGDTGTINRADLLLDLMFHDAVTNQAAGEASLASNVLHDLDLTGMLQLDRPMLVARINRPTSRLVIENAPSPPKIDQTTLLRVILPLKADKAEDGASSSRPK